MSRVKGRLVIIPMIPIVAGGIAKGIDIFRYDILKLPRNIEERHLGHMLRSHFTEGESFKSTAIEMQKGNKVVVQVFGDGCVMMRRISKEGLISGLKIIP